MTAPPNDDRASDGERGPIRPARLERQAGALAWMPGTRPVRFVLVTSRRRGRWVFPKGSISRGRSGPETAEREALEEAGVIGRAAPDAIGSYRGRKVRAPRSWPIEVEIYPLQIDEVCEHWPEEDQRTRRFVTLDEARALITDPGILRIAELFAAGR